MRQLNLNGVTLLALTDVVPPPADWAYAFAAHADEFDAAARRRWAPDGRFHTRFSVHALAANDEVVLIDAGLGPEPSPYFGGLRGALDRDMAAAGISPEQVTGVLFTHFHLDHVGWASRQGEPCFPHARYFAPATEIAHWKTHGAQSALPHHVAAFEQNVAPLLANGRLTALEEGEPAPFALPLRYRALPGHTPGHAAVICEGAGAALAIAGDCWHSPAQIERPDWGHRADRDPPAAAASRSKLTVWAHERGAVVAAGHFPEDAGVGRIEKTAEGGFVWRPLT